MSEQKLYTMRDVGRLEKRVSEIMEDACREIREQSRKVYHVDIDNMSKDEAGKALERVKQDFIQRSILAKMVEVDLSRPDSFLIIKETLTRIGVASDSAKKLHQSCHILHKAGKYYITHFKLLFELDGKTSNIDKIDIARQNTIAKLLESWNLVRVKSEIPSDELVPMKLIKIVPSSEKREWELVSKHRIGRK